jgi:Protein of unknown function (DUF1345)
MLTCKGDVIRARAARQDDSWMVILVIILLAVAASFVSIVGLLAVPKEAPYRTLNLGLAAATLILAWTLTQVVFTFHYAHEYYRPSGGPTVSAEGLDFRGDRNPDYWDFFYFATSFGAASQTSDVSNPDQASAPTRDAARNHVVLLQHGCASADHQSRGLHSLRRQSMEWEECQHITARARQQHRTDGMGDHGQGRKLQRTRSYRSVSTHLSARPAY